MIFPFTAEVDIAPKSQIKVEFLSGDLIVFVSNLTNSSEFTRVQTINLNASLPVDKIRYIIA
ncbi:hypothetical protein [Bacillus cereus]|uniref:Uncharacterized protein n=1 Tax=Bacillus cereus TaxID=1396 RepID=A0A2B9DKJ8_BACCE|nr:hypothetical protein [Bacillus cereus]PGM88344.1 hypothetical protein CN958_26385 [Bacillus cereus]